MATPRLVFKSPDGDLVRVAVGFSWQAFFVGSFRTFLRRSWPVLCLLGVLYAVYARERATLPSSSRLLAVALLVLGIYLGYMLFCGLYGNRWLVASLRRRGYKQIGEE